MGVCELVAFGVFDFLIWARVDGLRAKIIDISLIWFGLIWLGLTCGHRERITQIDHHTTSFCVFLIFFFLF